MAVNKNMRILVVDDFQTMRRIVINLLKQLGFGNVTEAADGQQALDKVKNEQIDLIISDWNMPNMTGIDLLRKVRASEQFAHIPFLMVTAEAQQENIIEAVQAKVSNYIVKPFTKATLEDKVTFIIKKMGL